MFRHEEWNWQYCGFWSLDEGMPVHDFYRALVPYHRLEIASLLRPIQKITSSAWGRPFFDPLEGAGGISEIIVPEIRDYNGAAYYRFYGYFGPVAQTYSFLHVVNKKVRNDREGKAIAKYRLDCLQLDDSAKYAVRSFVI
jgi:hypothetical protein